MFIEFCICQCVQKVFALLGSKVMRTDVLSFTWKKIKKFKNPKTHADFEDNCTNPILKEMKNEGGYPHTHFFNFLQISGQKVIISLRLRFCKGKSA